MPLSPSPAAPRKVEAPAVISSALEIYRDQVAILLSAAAAVFAVQLVLVLLLGPVGAILGIVASTFFQGMVVNLVRDVQDGRRDTSFSQLFIGVAPVVLPLIAVSILAGIGIAIGIVLLIAPGLFLLTIWSVVAPVTVIERPGVFAAFGRSRELVRGHGWEVFGVIVILFVISFGVGIILGIALSGLSSSAQAVVQFVINVLVSPLGALLVSVLYFTLRRIHGEPEVGDPEGAAPAPGIPGGYEPPAGTSSTSTPPPGS